MADNQTISKKDFIRRAEISYRWSLIKREQDILTDLAKIHRGSVVLDQWEIFQKRYPGHPAWEFAEWFEMLMIDEEEE